MNAIVALIVKDLKLLLRDKVGFFFTFFFPLIYCIFFGSLFGSQGRGSRAIQIVVVDEDQTESSKAFVAVLQNTPEFKVESATRDAAVQLVRKGERTAYVALPKGFGEARQRMFWGDPAKIETGIDPARQAEAGMVQGVLTKCAFEGLQDLFTNPDRMAARITEWTADLQKASDMDPMVRATMLAFFPALDRMMKALPRGEGMGRGWQPVSIENTAVSRDWKGPKNSYEVSFPQGIIWGVMGCAAAFGISLVVERTKGTLVRLRMAPLGRIRILCGKAGACCAATLGLQVLLIVIGILVFGIRPGSYPLLALAVLCVTSCFVGLMMLLSTLGRTEQAAGGIGWAILLVMAMIGGGMVPQFVMPEWLTKLGAVSPVKWSILALDGAVWRQFSVSEMMLPCGVLLAIGLVCFLLGARVFQWTEEG